MVNKCCGIFKTQGDRRLQTHLFQGLVMLVKRAIEHHCLNLPKRAEDGFSQDHISNLQDIFTDKKRFGFGPNDVANQIEELEKLKIEQKTRALTDNEMKYFCKTKILRSTMMTAPKMEFIREDHITNEDIFDLSRDMWEERKETE